MKILIFLTLLTFSSSLLAQTNSSQTNSSQTNNPQIYKLSNSASPQTPITQIASFKISKQDLLNNNENIYTNKALSYMYSRNWDLARASLILAISVNPSNPKSWFLLSENDLFLGKNTEGLKALKKAESLDSSLKFAYPNQQRRVLALENDFNYASVSNSFFTKKINNANLFSNKFKNINNLNYTLAGFLFIGFGAGTLLLTLILKLLNIQEKQQILKKKAVVG